MTQNIFGLSQVSKCQDKKNSMYFILHALEKKCLKDIKTINTH